MNDWSLVDGGDRRVIPVLRLLGRALTALMARSEPARAKLRRCIVFNLEEKECLDLERLCLEGSLCKCFGL